MNFTELVKYTAGDNDSRCYVFTIEKRVQYSSELSFFL